MSYGVMKKMFININKQFPLLVNDEIIKQIIDSENIVKRGEYIKFVVDFFEFPQQVYLNECPEYTTNLEDQYKDDIKKLIDL
jgi:hypothetical protein